MCSGVFSVINSFVYSENQSPEIILSDDLGRLELGLDIQEVPIRGLSLLVRGEETTQLMSATFQELKKLASISGYDYFSCEPFGEDIQKFLCTEGKTEVYEVRPRLFRKLVND